MSPNGSGIRLFSCSRIALDSIARSARGDVRWVAAVVVARTGPRAAVLRRSEPTCSSSVSDDKVGGFLARSAASGSEQQTEEKHLRSLLLRAPARDSRRSQLDSSAARASRSVRIARSARGDVRWVATVLVGVDETKKHCSPSPPADRRREHRESAAVVVARTGPRAAVLRRSEPTCSSSVSDDKVGGFLARSAASGSEQQTEEERLRSLLLRAPARDSRRSQLDSSAARASRSVRLLAPLAAIFAGSPPSSSELTKRKKRCSAISSCRSAARTSRIRRRRRRSRRTERRRAAEERADMLFVGERRQSRRLHGAIRSERERATNKGNNASAPFYSVRRRAIPDARSWILQLLAHRARFDCSLRSRRSSLGRRRRRRSQLGKIRTSEAARDPPRDDHRRLLAADPLPGSSGRLLPAAAG